MNLVKLGRAAHLLAALIALSTPAFAAPNATTGQAAGPLMMKKPAISTGVNVRPGGGLAPLTAQECTDLGGSIAWTGICKSGSSCMRRGADNKDYEVCITAS